MRKLLLTIVLAVAALAAGCSGRDSVFDNSVNMQDFQYQPHTLTVAAGTTVTWRNLDNTTHSVTSGRLLPFPDPMVHEVAIVNSVFLPAERRVRVGDTIRWTNRDLGTQQIRFLPNQGIEYISPPFGQDQTVSLQIMRAGAFDYTSEFNPAARGRIIAEGIPDADGLFDSRGIQPSQSFSLTFNTPGTFTYFCTFHNIEEGRIVVQ